MIADAGASLRRTYYVGLLFILLAALLWSLNGALIKLINRDGAGPSGVTIAFYRSLVGGLFLLPMARGRFATLLVARAADEPRAGRRRLRPAAVWCCVFFTTMTVCFVTATTMTAASNAIILQYTSTFWIFGLSPLVLGERASGRDFIVLALAMLGIVVIFVGNAGTDLAGLAVALGSGLFYALLTLMLRRLRDADSAAVTVFNTLGSAAIMVPIVWMVGEFAVPWRIGALLVAMGVVQFGLPYWLYSLGLARVPAYQVALLTLLEPVLVPLWTYLAVGERVPLWTAVGGGVILAALLLFVAIARRAPAVKATLPASS
jgi:drug/metabolite transporter (DMT)-like permease